MSKTVLILGGGWGGLTTAHALKGSLPEDWRVLVIEKRPSFVFYPPYLRVIIGEKPDLREVESPMKDLLRKDIEILNDEVIRIHPETRTVQTQTQTLQADHLVIAMGSDLFPEMIPGFREAALNLYDTEGSFRIHHQLKEFRKGKIAVLITRTPFRCPPAPYEAAMLADAFLRERGVRNDVEISIYTPEKQPMPVAGPEVGKMFHGMLLERELHYYPEYSVTRIDPNSRKIFFANEQQADYDLLIGVPPHGAPKAVAESGLTDASGYIPVHPQTMQVVENAEELSVKFPQVYAIGDTTAIRLMNGMMLPKAGVFAEEQAHTVAANISSQVKGEKPTGVFTGRGVCYVDVGNGLAAEGSGDFYAYPAPWIQLQQPSKSGRIAKHEFEKIFENWFVKSKS